MAFRRASSFSDAWLCKSYIWGILEFKVSFPLCVLSPWLLRMGHPSNSPPNHRFGPSKQHQGFPVLQKPVQQIKVPPDPPRNQHPATPGNTRQHLPPTPPPNPQGRVTWESQLGLRPAWSRPSVASFRSLASSTAAVATRTLSPAWSWARDGQNPNGFASERVQAW